MTFSGSCFPTARWPPHWPTGAGTGAPLTRLRTFAFRSHTSAAVADPRQLHPILGRIPMLSRETARAAVGRAALSRSQPCRECRATIRASHRVAAGHRAAGPRQCRRPHGACMSPRLPSGLARRSETGEITTCASVFRSPGRPRRAWRAFIGHRVVLVTLFGSDLRHPTFASTSGRSGHGYRHADIAVSPCHIRRRLRSLSAGVQLRSSDRQGVPGTDCLPPVWRSPDARSPHSRFATRPDGGVAGTRCKRPAGPSPPARERRKSCVRPNRRPSGRSALAPPPRGGVRRWRTLYALSQAASRRRP